jgi:hypothetical protein
METIMCKIIQTKDYWDYLSILGTLICSILSVAILILTYRLASKINKRLDKPILEKQLNTVYNLMEELQNTNLKIQLDINGESHNILRLNFFQIKSKQEEYEEYKEYNIIIDKEMYEKLSFINMKDNPFLPNKIAVIIEKLELNFNKENIILLKDLGDKYVYLSKDEALNDSSVPLLAVKHYINSDHEVYKYSNNDIHNLNEFVNILIAIDREIKDWIENPFVNLNLK